MSLVREFKIKWLIGFNQKFCDQKNVLRFLEMGKKLKWINPNQQTVKGVNTPTTPQKKEKEKSSSSASETIANDFLMQKMMQNPEILKEYLNYLQKQDKKEEDKKDESAGSSLESTFDPFDGPCAQDPVDF